MSFLKLVNIGKSYDSYRVLHNINLDFSLNEFVCIVGPSGSGKTTLLNILGLLEESSEGNILINGCKIKRNKYQYYKYNFYGYVYQNYEMVDYYSVKNNIKIYDDCISDDDIKSLADEFGCNELIDKYPNQLSGGEKQRISLIRALVKNPKILICDEPTGSLDSKTSESIMKYLKDNNEGKLIIMATHDIKLAKKYATRIIVLNFGQITNDTTLSNDGNLIDQAEEVQNESFGKINIFKRNINYFKTKGSLPIPIILLFSICLCLLSSAIGLSTGVKQYINDVKSERLDSNYFEMTYYKNNNATSNHDSIIKLLDKNGLEYEEINNYSYLLNNFFYKNIKKENDINFDFEISVISFSNNTDEEIIVNSLFKEKYESKYLSMTRDTQILEYNLNLNKEFTIDKVSIESNIYNNPRIYLSYKIIADLFDDDFKQYIFLQDMIVVPNMFFISSPLDNVFELFKTSEYFTSYIIAATSSSVKYIVYKSSSVIMYETFADLTDSLSLCLVIISIIVLALVLSIFNLVCRNILLKRKRELALINSYGISNSSLVSMIFSQNLIILVPSLIMGLLLYFSFHYILLNISSNIFGISYNILEFEIKGIITCFYAIILIAFITSLYVTSSKNIKSLLMELHNE